MPVDPRLYAFVKSQMVLGKSRDEISAILIGQGGWNQSDVDQALASVGKSLTAPASPAPATSANAGPGPAPLSAIMVSPLATNPNAGGRVRSAGSTTKTLIVIVVTVIVLVLLGAAAYYYRGSLSALLLKI